MGILMQAVYDHKYAGRKEISNGLIQKAWLYVVCVQGVCGQDGAPRLQGEGLRKTKMYKGGAEEEGLVLGRRYRWW